MGSKAATSRFRFHTTPGMCVCMARNVTIACDSCGQAMPIKKGKEALVAEDENSYRLYDLCATCLDGLLKKADSVNDADGYRQQAAALVRLREGESVGASA